MKIKNDTLRAAGLPVWIGAAASFLVPYLVLMLCLAARGFYPFGEKSLLIMDMNGQYAPFYESLRQIASGESGVFFSWSKSMGSNFTGLFAYYLSSPLSLIVLLFRDMQLAVFHLTLVKVALCGVTSFFCFRYILNARTVSVLLFSASYALMSYNLVYSMCLMWLDAVILLPVILLGAERILRGKKPYLFILSLALMLISNFYTGYMVCVFSVLFIVFRYFSFFFFCQKEKEPKRKETDIGAWIQTPLKTAGRFAAFYAIAGGLSLWLLLPAFFDLQSGKIGYSGYVPTTLTNFPLRSWLSAFAPQTYTSITNSGVPALYGGVLVGVLCIAYFFVRRVPVRVRLMTFAFFLFLLCSFWFTKLDIAWHIFQYPNWFPYRYAFVFHFLSVFTACAAWQAIAGQLAERNSKKSRKIKLPAAVAPLVLLPLVCLDLYANAGAMLKGLDRQFGYKEAGAYAEFRSETLPVVEAVKRSDDSFYRMEKTYFHTWNDALSLGYRGVTHYSSLFNKNLLTFSKELGFAQTYFWNSYIGSTPVTDALFGVKYVLSKTGLPYPARWEENGITVYENPYALPIGFMVSDIRDIPSTGHDCFAKQNEMLGMFVGKDADVFRPVDFTKGTAEDGGLQYRFTVPPWTGQTDRPIYASFPAYNNPGNALVVNGAYVAPYFTNDDNHAVYIGSFVPGTEVTISFDAKSTEPGLLGEYIYALDTNALAGAAARLKAGGLYRLQSRTFGVTQLEGAVNAQESGYMFTSIPYDKGWKVRVGGQKVDCVTLNGTFMAFPVGAGEHEVSMVFVPRGLMVGAVVSAAALLVLLGMVFWGRSKAKSRKEGDC